MHICEFLSLLMSFQPSLGCLWEGMGSSLYAYLRRFSMFRTSLAKSWIAHFMHIYVVSVLFEMFERRPGELIVCIFVSFQPCLGCLWKGLESRFYAYLRRFSLFRMSLANTWRAVFMHIYVVLALFDMTLGRLGEQLLCIFTSF